MTDEHAQPARRLSDPRIDKIDHDLGALASTVSALQTSVALGNQSAGFAADALKRVESGQQAMAEDITHLSSQVLASSSDPIATPAGRAISGRIDVNERGIADLRGIVEGTLAEARGGIRTLKFLTSVLAVVGTVLSIVVATRALGL